MRSAGDVDDRFLIIMSMSVVKCREPTSLKEVQ
jgi:hypothetical protein